MCEGEDYCESKEDILQWLSGKFVILLYNQIRFDPNRFKQAARLKESRIDYIPINSQMRTITPYKI